MEVKCPKCQTLYHLDEKHITGDGINVKCTTCNNIFKVQAPAHSVAQVGWHLKKPDGTIINFAHLGELQKLILEHRAHLEDMISKDGQTYKKLSDMPEFAPLFLKRNQMVSEQKQVQEDKEKVQSEPKLSSPPVQSVAVPISTPQDEDIDIYGRPRKKGKGGLFIAVGVIVLIIVAAAGFFLKDMIFGSKLTEEELNALKSANESILASDYPDLERAYDILDKYTKNIEKPPKQEILASLTMSILLRGELLKLENAIVEKRIREILKVDKYSEVAKKLNEQFNERQKLIQDLSNQSMTLLKKLNAEYGSKPLAKYVALEYIRIQAVFDPQSAEKGMKILEELKEKKDFQYADRLKFVEGDLILKTQDSKSEEALKLLNEVISKDPKFILPRFMMARYYTLKGEYLKALEQVTSILNNHPANSVAKSLKESIEDLIKVSQGSLPGSAEASAKDNQNKPEEKKAEDRASVENVVSEKSPAERVATEEKKEPAKKVAEEVVREKEKVEGAERKAKPEKVAAAKSSGNYAQIIKEAKKLAGKGQTDKAADMFLQASELEPTLAEPFLLMGWMYIDAGKNEQAVNSFQRAIKLKGNKCDGYMGLGEANKFMKRNNEAKKYYQMYLEQCPNGPDAATAKNAINTLR